MTEERLDQPNPEFAIRSLYHLMSTVQREREKEKERERKREKEKERD